MLKLGHQISENKYPDTSAVKNFIDECQKFIQNAKKTIYTILKCTLFMALLSAALLPAIGLALLVDEDREI